jgi:hypothetical protein
MPALSITGWGHNSTLAHVSASLPLIPDGRLSRVRFETAASFALSQGPSCLLGCLSRGRHTHPMLPFASSASYLLGQRVVPGCHPAPASWTGSPACPPALRSLLRPDVPVRGPLPRCACGSRRESSPVGPPPAGPAALPDVLAAPPSLRAWTPTPVACGVPLPVSSPTTSAFPPLGPGRRSAMSVQRLPSGA